MGKSLTTDKFIEKALLKHNSKYSYEKAEYFGCKILINITCPIHGYFWQLPKSHLEGKGCKKCALELLSKLYVSNKEEFIEKSIKLHGNKYNYKNVTYINGHTNVDVMCEEHGVFSIQPGLHLLGHGCKYCSGHKFNTEILIEKSKEKHNYKYDYTKSEYKSFFENMIITCPIHGDFNQTPAIHLRGGGCPYCANNKSNTEIFIGKSVAIHGCKYNYSKSKYVSKYTKLCIICSKHGEFYQAPSEHLRGSGCQICKESKLETEIRVLMENNNIKYIYEEHFKWLGRQTVDFYLPEHNMAIECQGAQHFKPVEIFGGIKAYKKGIIMDNKKFNLCKENGLKLFYFSNEAVDNYIDKIFINKQELLNEILKKKMLHN